MEEDPAEYISRIFDRANSDTAQDRAIYDKHEKRFSRTTKLVLLTGAIAILANLERILPGSSHVVPETAQLVSCLVPAVLGLIAYRSSRKLREHGANIGAVEEETANVIASHFVPPQPAKGEVGKKNSHLN